MDANEKCVMAGETDDEGEDEVDDEVASDFDGNGE